LVPDGPPLRNRGQHKLSIDFNGMPRGTKTAHKGDDGLIKEVKLIVAGACSVLGRVNELRYQARSVS
jgi:hypothetical protein